MTREKFVKYKFKAYMSIDFKHPGLSYSVECMLIGINYDTEILLLRSFKDNPFENDEFPAHISHCELTRPKLKLNK